MVSASERIQQISTEQSDLVQQIEVLQQQRSELQGGTFASRRKEQQIAEVQSKIDKLTRERKVAEQLLREVKEAESQGFEVSEAEQQKVIQRRAGFLESQVKRERVFRLALKGKLQKEREEARKLGFKIVRERGKKTFVDLKTGERFEDLPSKQLPAKIMPSQVTAESIEQKVIEEPIGEPTPPVEQTGFKKFFQRLGDIFTGATLGFLVPTASTSTLVTAGEPKDVKAELKDIPIRALSKTNILGVGAGGISFGVKPTGEKGFGFSDLHTALTFEQVVSAEKLRKEGEQTISAQTQQVEQINKSVKKIEEEQSKLSDTTQFTKDVEKFTKDVAKFEESLRITKSISNIGAFPEKLTSLERERKALLSEQARLQKEQQKLSKEQAKFEKLTVSELKGLRKIGVVSKFTDTGEIKFTSKDLEKKVAPVGIKLQKSLLKEDKKLSAKNIALGSTALAREVGVAVGIGYLTGGTGAIARISSRVAKLPKAIRVTVKGAGVGLAGLGIGLSTISGFKAGQVEDIGKIGAVLGGLKTTGQIAGFGAGAFKGTKVHFQKIEKQIISGRTTKSIADIKTGLEVKGKGTFAKQLSKFETRVTGTKMKITTLADIKTKFISKQGVSDIKAISRLEGKVPRGLPEKVITKGQALETEKLTRARLFTQVPKIKGFTKQDILISKKILDVKGVDIKTKDLFKPFTRLERVVVLSGVKTVGKPVKVKKFPKEIFTFGEKHLFRVQKGTEKVAGIGEFAEARADTLFKSRQFILTTPSVKIGKVDVRRFTTVATTKGISADLLKDSLRGKLLVLNLKTKDLVALPLDKRGQVALFRPPRVTQPIPQIKTPKLKTDLKLPTLDTRTLLKIQLKQLVPQILARESALIKPSIPFVSAGALGIKETLRLQVQTKQIVNLKSLTKLKLDLTTKVTQIQTQRIIQVQSLKLAQVPKLQLATVPVSRTALVTAPPKVVVPVIPALPPIVLGKAPKRKKRRKGARVDDVLTFSEGFTAKQLGLAPRVLTPAQARKLLSTKLTGLGIRRGVIIK